MAADESRAAGDEDAHGPERSWRIDGRLRSSPVDHVVIRKLDHLAGSAARPELSFAIETRDRPGPLFKRGAFPDDGVWVQLHGGLFVAKARVRICWVGE